MSWGRAHPSVSPSPLSARAAPLHPALLSPGPGLAPRPPRRREAALRCGRPRPSGATRSGCACRARSCRLLSGPCPRRSAAPWRPRSVRCGGRPGEAPPRALLPPPPLPAPALALRPCPARPPLPCPQDEVSGTGRSPRTDGPQQVSGGSKQAGASGAPSRGPLARAHPVTHPLGRSVRRGEAGGSACGTDLSRRPLLVPPDLGLQTGTSPGRLVRNQRLSPFPALLPWWGAGIQTPPALFLLTLFTSLLTLSFQGLVWEEV